MRLHQKPSAQHSEPAAKDLIGSYAIIKEIGRGTWGTCFRAVNTATQDIVSLRVLSNSFSKRELSSIQTAVRYLRDIESDRFQQAIDEKIGSDRAYLASEFVPGVDLSLLVKQSGRIPVRQAIYCIARAIEGLDAANRKSIVHGELRPSKIVVDQSGNVAIRDLAIAQVTRARRQLGADPKQIQLLPKHHIDFLAPEVLSGGKPNFSSDLYSLGCILYYILTGKAPYANKDASRTAKAHREAVTPRASRRVKDIPTTLDECLTRMLAKQPADRFGNYKQCHGALREIVKLLPAEERPTKELWEKLVVDKSATGSFANARRFAFPKWLMYSVLGVALLAGLGTSCIFVFQSDAETNKTVEPPGNRGIPTAESEDSFELR